LEARAIRTALDVLEARSSRLMDYELTNADSAGLGMICGGRGRLLIEYVDPAAGTRPDVLAALRDVLSTGGRGWLVTRLTPAEAPANAVAGASSGIAAGGGEQGLSVERCLVDAAGNVSGDPACSLPDLQALPKMGGALDGHTAGDRPGMYVQPVGLPGTAYVFGAGHCGKSLVPILSMVGFRTVIVDDRVDFANPERFPDADAVVIPETFENAFAGLDIDEQSFLVIMTRGHMFDRTVLAQALHTQARYIGMIGSRKKVAETRQALLDQGFTDEDLARVHAPIGLPIGAETPEEIAVSIAAEIIRVQHG